MGSSLVVSEEIWTLLSFSCFSPLLLVCSLWVSLGGKNVYMEGARKFVDRTSALFIMMNEIVY